MATRFAAINGSKSESKPVVFCDFDGTVTQIDVTDLLLTQFAHPSWREVEQEWIRGLIGSRECLERQMALVEASAKELNSLIDSVPIDPHFSKFFRFTRKRDLPFYLLSDGFDFIIRRVLKRCRISGQVRNGTHLFSSGLRVEGRRLLPWFPHSALPCEHGCAMCKAAVMRRLKRDRHPVIFIGDGLSDRYAVEEADLVFARRPLLAYCRERGLACEPFGSFVEIEQALEPWVFSLDSRRRREALAVAR